MPKGKNEKGNRIGGNDGGDGDVWALKLARGFSMDKSTNQWLAEKRHK